LKITNVLDLYDLYITSQIKEKHASVENAHFIYAPPEREIGFRYASEKFGKNLIFPIFFIFRSTPAKRYEKTSAVAYNLNLNLDGKRGFQAISVQIQYQVDFFSNSMYDLNKVNVEYFKFNRDPHINFDFSDISVNFKNQFPVNFEGDMEANHTIDEMFTIGRFFRYSYRINLTVPIFDVSTEVPLEKIKFTIFDIKLENQIYTETLEDNK
jgi:hypothetical protein